DRAGPEALSYHNLSGPPWLGPVRTTATDAEVVWRGVDLTQGERAALHLGIAALDTRCESLRLNFENQYGERAYQRVILRGRRTDAAIAIGVSALILPLQQNRQGTLRIGFECPIAATLQLEEVALYRVSMGLHYGAPFVETLVAPEAP
ncbi:hypothetical protein, partial [Melaminivora sp.]|uniref:hypothetical protein n=1 Tax=Melaminivora sp. TaxID=1933032 RepID=UPI0028A7111F